MCGKMNKGEDELCLGETEGAIALCLHVKALFPPLRRPTQNARLAEDSVVTPYRSPHRRKYAKKASKTCKRRSFSSRQGADYRQAVRREQRGVNIHHGDMRITPTYHLALPFVSSKPQHCSRHLAKQAGLETDIRKPDLQRPRSSPKSRRMTPEVILRELSHVVVGDILLETTDGLQLALRRVARPTAEPARILASLGLKLPERLSNDRVL
jgi:hypothetical protein